MTVLARLVEVDKSFGPMDALRGVSIEIATGEVVGLLGANGAGKTTLIRCLLGLISPDRGTVTVVGRPPNREVLRQVGYVPQGLGLYTDLSIEENLDFRRVLYGVGEPPQDEQVLRSGAIPVGHLPLGVQRRAAFAAALAHRPRLLVLDEPTSGVGALGRAVLWDGIRSAAEDGAGVVVTTHHLEEAEQCDRLIMLSGGEVVASGPVEGVIGDRRTVTVAGGHPLEVLDRMQSHGLGAGFSGEGIAVVGASIDQVRSALEGLEGLNIEERAATLEEAFADLVAR